MLLAVMLVPATLHAQLPDSATWASGGTTHSSIPSLLPSPVMMAAAGGLFAGALVLDHNTREDLYLERPSDLSGLAAAGDRLGNPLFFVPPVVGLYLAGRLTHHPGLMLAAEHMAAGLLATGVVNGVLKISVGRARPYMGGDADVFRPFSLNNHFQSFPSGHTMVAFSLATSVAEESHSVAAAVGAYAVAGMVGWSRIYYDAHWMSDVVAGAVLGTVTTRATILWLRRREAAHSAGPRIAVGPTGFLVQIPVQ